jgi:hypothetical protein
MPIETRKSNIDKHPGAIVAPAPRKTSAQVQAEKRAVQELKAAAAAEKRANILAMAQVETAIRENEENEQSQAAQPPLSIKIKARPTSKKAVSTTEDEWENYAAPMHGRGSGRGRGRGRGGRGGGAKHPAGKGGRRSASKKAESARPTTPETLGELLVCFLFKQKNQ